MFGFVVLGRISKIFYFCVFTERKVIYRNLKTNEVEKKLKTTKVEDRGVKKEKKIKKRKKRRNKKA